MTPKRKAKLILLTAAGASLMATAVKFSSVPLGIGVVSAAAAIFVTARYLTPGYDKIDKMSEHELERATFQAALDLATNIPMSFAYLAMSLGGFALILYGLLEIAVR